MTSLNESRALLSEENVIRMVDLRAQQALIRSDIDAAVGRVLDRGAYIQGPEVADLEEQLACFSAVEHCISCGSGTDALLMILMALNIGPGDAVICPAFTFTATPETIALLGAETVFADVDPFTYNLDPVSVHSAINVAIEAGYTPRAVIAVDLFGLPADYEQLADIAETNDLEVICDAAQSYGAKYKGLEVGQLGCATATSFFPAKPLGCYGDGGAILTDNEELASTLRSIRLHGRGREKYDIVRVGINGRLDTIQAAILLEKLKLFPGEIERRRVISNRYSCALSDTSIGLPHEPEGSHSVWAQYTIRLNRRRDRFRSLLLENGIPTGVYYPRPLHHQPAYRDCLAAASGLKNAEMLAEDVVSLPMHPYLEQIQQEYIIDNIKECLPSI